MSSQSQVRVQIPLALKSFDATARLAGVERPHRELIGNPHIEGEAPLEFDLPVQQVNRFRSGQAEFGEDLFNFTFEARFNPGTNCSCFTHTPNVARLLPQCKPPAFRDITAP